MAILKRTILVLPSYASTFFKLCKSTPLPIIGINGVNQQEPMDWMTSSEFPNPGAYELSTNYELHRRFFGEKIAKTIVVYLDKVSHEQILILYPNGQVSIRAKNLTEAKERLNHASRKDFLYQISVRKRLAGGLLKSKTEDELKSEIKSVSKKLSSFFQKGKSK